MTEAGLHSTKVKLEPYSSREDHASIQAVILSKLISAERSWLKDIQPGTVKRYEYPIKGKDNVIRIAGSEAVKAYLIHQNRTPSVIGVATIIAGQGVVHPIEGLIEGSDLDYWVKARTSLNTHRLVAAALKETVVGPAFATVVQGSTQSEERDFSFGELLKKVGEPANLTTTVPGDPYEIARNGALAQIYQLPP